MTRIFTDGAEMGDAMFWDFNAGAVPIVAVTNPAPYGAGEWSYRGAYDGGWRVLSSALNEFYIRYRLRTSNVAMAAEAYMLGFRYLDEPIGRFTVDVLGRFAALIGFHTEIWEATDIVMQPDTWYLIEIHFVKGHPGTFEVYIDGTLEVDYHGDTDPDHQVGDIDNIYFRTGAYTYVYIDDLALNDTNGVSDNSWCGDGIIMKMYPNDNGTHNNWTGSDGDSVNNYLLVDEFPNDGDLTYVSSDAGVAGTQDQYNLTDLDYTNKTVLRIYPEARARKTAPGGTLKLGILPSGGVDSLSAARTLYEDYYARIVGDEYTTNPVDAGAWEEVDLDALEMIIETG